MDHTGAMRSDGSYDEDTDTPLRATARRLVAEVPLVNNHPDIAGALRRAGLLSIIGPALAAPFATGQITMVLAPEARGPIIAALVAVHLEVGLSIARKDDGNHPGSDIWLKSDPTWRGHSEEFQIRSFDFNENDRVLLVDDWITTGASLRALRSLASSAGASVVGATTIISKASDDTLKDLNAHRLIDFGELCQDT